MDTKCKVLWTEDKRANEQFLHTFFVSYRAYTECGDILDVLDDALSTAPSCTELLSPLLTIRTWISAAPEDFKRDTRIFQSVADFLQTIDTKSLEHIQLKKFGQIVRAELIKAREPLHPRAPSLNGLKSIYHVDAAALADALTNITADAYKLVYASDLVAVICGSDAERPCFDKISMNFHATTRMVSMELRRSKTSFQPLAEKFIDVAALLLDSGNFHASVAICRGVQQEIERYSAALSAQARKSLDTMAYLYDEDHIERYHEAFHRYGWFPLLDLYIEAHMTPIDGDIVDFRKMRVITNKVERSCRKFKQTVQCNLDVKSLLIRKLRDAAFSIISWEMDGARAPTVDELLIAPGIFDRHEPHRVSDDSTLVITFSSDHISDQSQDISPAPRCSLSPSCAVLTVPRSQPPRQFSEASNRTVDVIFSRSSTAQNMSTDV